MMLVCAWAWPTPAAGNREPLESAPDGRGAASELVRHHSDRELPVDVEIPQNACVDTDLDWRILER
jgi:hypothetical protein